MAAQLVKGDYSATSTQSQGIVDVLIARRKTGKGTAAVEYKLDEAPSIANAWPAALKRPVMLDTTHMMMNGSDEGRGYNANDIMDVILNWSDKHVSKMKNKQACDRDDGHDRDDDHDRDDGHGRW